MNVKKLNNNLNYKINASDFSRSFVQAKNANLNLKYRMIIKTNLESPSTLGTT